MKSELFDLWIKKLEDGSYTQGNGALRRKEDEGDLYCCLGVLCDISGFGEWGAVGAYGTHVEYIHGADSAVGILPWELAENLGVYTDGSPRRGDGFANRYGTPMGMNDSGVTFSGIATALKEFRHEFVED